MVALEEIVVGKKEKWCLCHLPVELLQLILSHLSVLDYLHFRAVCKCWHSAFSKCSLISLHQERKPLPWFLILTTQLETDDCPHSPLPRPLLFTTGKLGDLSTKRIYTTDIPELCGTQILLSKYGWLLLFSSGETSQSLFFFNLFSRARIDLPFMNVAELCRPVFDISAPPTSPECMVFVISCCHRDYTISLCTRRDSAWTTKVCKPSKYPTPATNTVFANGIWYCLDESGQFITFDTVSCSWRFLALPEHLQLSNRVKHVSYAINRGNQVFLCIHGFRRFEIALRDPLEVTKSRFIGGRDLEKLENLFRTDVESAMLELQNVLEVDSFNTGAWCGLCDSDGVMTFRWHHFRSHLDYYYRLNERSCHGNNKNCSTIIMWVEPTWFHPFPNMRWKI